MIQSGKISAQWSVLAGLRFILAVCVLITHSGIVAPGNFLWLLAGQTGYPAVFGFFMVSGYSVAASIVARPQGYFKRRVRRIYPAYLFAIIFACLIVVPGPLHLPEGQILFLDGWKVIVGNLLMLQGTLVPAISTDGALWSLSVEWWCYMVAMILIRYNNRISVLIAITSFIGMALFSWRTGIVNASVYPLGYNFIFMIWAWLTGFIYFREPTKSNFMIMLLLPMLMFEIFYPLKFASVVVAVSALTILFSKTIVLKRQWIRQALDWLGAMSYPLYLLHPPLLYILTANFHIRKGGVIILMILSIVSIGYFIAERIFNLIGEAFTSRHSEKLSSE
jgi:peptidoglycan/LPS O-acetylase OafA/YrhL